MRYRISHVAFMLFTIAAITFGTNQRLSAQESEVKRLIDVFLDGKFDQGKLNGNVLVVKNGKTFYERSFGYSDGSKTSHLTKDHRFQIGSVVKEFPAVAIMQLQEKRLLSADDKISKYLPGLPEWSEKVSIKDLLQYSSGLPKVNFRAYRDKGLSISDAAIMKDVRNIERLEFEPGEDYLYTNYSPILLTKIVERITKQSFSDYAEGNLLIPHGLKNTLFKSRYPYEDRTLMAIPFNSEFKEDDFKTNARTFVFTSTAADMVNWFDRLDSFKIVEKRAVKFLSETAGNRANVQSPMGYTLWENNNLNQHSHHGSNLSYECIVRRFRKDGLTIVILTNQCNRNVLEISIKIYEILNEM